MKTRLFLILLLALIPSFIYSQEDLGVQEKNFHFIEVGLGAGLSEIRNDDDAAFSINMSNGLGKYMANFLDYNLYFDKSGVSRHEVSFKIGPYYQLNRYTYVAVSSGVSLFINSRDHNPNYEFGTFYYEDDYLLNIPVQAKLNIGLYKGICFGLKGTYNKMVDKHHLDRGSVQGYLAFGW